jgi:DNA helicase HerA-like ATPase
MDEPKIVADLPAADGARLGRIISVTGSRASIALQPSASEGNGEELNCPAVGELVKVVASQMTVVGVVSEIAVASLGESGHGAGGIAKVEFVGELETDPATGELCFHRGTSQYPKLFDGAYQLSEEETVAAHVNDLAKSVSIGTLVPRTSAQARVNVESVYDRHFAVLGSTGTGKTCAVSLLLNRIIERIDGARVFIIDPHDEYRQCFSEIAEVINPRNITLPFWLFNFEEIVDVFFKARPGIESEVEILRDLIPAAKRLYARNARANGHDVSASNARMEAAFTIDTPVPYRLSDLLKLIENRMGSLAERENVAAYKRLKARIEAVSFDPRYSFMFSQRTIEDTMSDVIGRLFRVPADGKPITIMEIAGFPTEVVDALVSVLCRLAFDFNVWSNGALPLLVVAEEAHRYIPASKALGFGPTRKAISRIAKEGRKYRLSICLVSQRPSEIDPTILSQCHTVFAMRLSSDADQAIIRAGVVESAAGMLASLPSIGEREAIAFGEAVSLPMRLRFTSVPQEALPRRRAMDRESLLTGRAQDRELVERVVATWRAASTRYGAGSGDTAEFAPGSEADLTSAHAMSTAQFEETMPPGESAPPVAEPPRPQKPRTVDWQALREKAGAGSP